MSNGLPPVAEAAECVGTLVGAVGVITLFEVTIGRWLRGKYRYQPPAEDPGPPGYDVSAQDRWPAGGGVT